MAVRKCDVATQMEGFSEDLVHDLASTFINIPMHVDRQMKSYVDQRDMFASSVYTTSLYFHN